MSIKRTWQRGFSLIELSVSLLVIALIAGAGISMGQGAINAADRVQTQQRLATIRSAIENYAALNGFLPCPADRAHTPVANAASFGVEQRTNQTTCTTGTGLVSVTVGSSSGFIGALPTRSLGLPDIYIADSWGQKFTYAVSAAHISGANNYHANEGMLQVNYGDRNGTNYATTTSYALGTARSISTVASGTGGVYRFTTTVAHGFSVGNMVAIAGVDTIAGNYIVSAVPSTTQFELLNAPFATSTLSSATAQRVTPTAGQGATYVVISHGANGVGGFLLQGATVKAACPAIGTLTNGNETENCDDSNLIFYDTEFNNTSSQTSLLFDDYVIWGTNMATRALLNYAPYTSCPAGTCDAWCASCAANYPNAPSTMTSPKLCKKVIIDASASICDAACYWAGTSTLPANPGFVSCP